MLAHSLAGLTIALEATASRIEQGAEHEAIPRACVGARARPRRTQETRRRSARCVASARIGAGGGIEALVAEYRAGAMRRHGPVDGDADPAEGPDRARPCSGPCRSRSPTSQSTPRGRRHGRAARRHSSGDQVVLLVEDRASGLAAADPGLPTRRRLRVPRDARASEGLGGSSTPAPPRRVARRAAASSPPATATAARRRVSGAVSDSDPGARRRRPGTGARGPDDAARSRAGIEPVAAAATARRRSRCAAAPSSRRRADGPAHAAPRRRGGDAAASARRSPRPRSSCLTTHADESSILDALRAGARATLTKDAGIAEISRAVHAAAAHQALLDPVVQSTLLEAAGDRPRAVTAQPAASGRAHPARGRGAVADRARAVERRDRAALVGQRGDGQERTSTICSRRSARVTVPRPSITPTPTGSPAGIPPGLRRLREGVRPSGSTSPRRAAGTPGRRSRTRR